VNDYIRLLENTGFTDIAFIGHTECWTSSKTRGAEFIATKPI